MRRKRVLKHIKNAKITPQQGYYKLYGPKVRKSRFIKLSLSIKEHKVLSAMFKILFILPLPISFVKLVPKSVFNESDISKKEAYELLQLAWGLNVKLISKDVKLAILIF